MLLFYALGIRGPDAASASYGLLISMLVIAVYAFVSLSCLKSDGKRRKGKWTGDVQLAPGVGQQPLW